MIGPLLWMSLASATELPTCRELHAPERSSERAADPFRVGTLRWTAHLFVRSWQATFSRADGPSCSFTPSCSAYALHAVERNGAFFGAVLGAERVMRNHRGWRYQPCRIGQRVYLYDPVSHHDAWREGRP